MIHSYRGKLPQIHKSAFIAPSADIIGEVSIGADSNIWFQVVIRGDVNTISIGERTNIQDHSCLHVTRKTAPLKVGSDVTVGHRVLLHGCTVEDSCLIGMGSVIMDGAVIGRGSLVAAGSLVTEGKKMPSGFLILGSPAKAVRSLTEDEKRFLPQSAAHYVEDGREYREFFTKEGQSR